MFNRPDLPQYTPMLHDSCGIETDEKISSSLVESIKDLIASGEFGHGELTSELGNRQDSDPLLQLKETKNNLRAHRKALEELIDGITIEIESDPQSIGLPKLTAKQSTQLRAAVHMALSELCFMPVDIKAE